jgi:Fur family ferric uptake transcriptional regulator
LLSFDRITLYRTIKLFAEKGVIHEIAISGEDASYAMCNLNCSETHQNQHIHFQCTSCSSVSCIEMEKIPSVSLPNYKIDQLEIQATGICPNCL